MGFAERFENANGQKSDFEQITNKRSDRKDLHAFLLLDELFPKSGDLVSYAMHDQYYLDYKIKELETLSDEQILELQNCGVLFDQEEECLFLFT